MEGGASDTFADRVGQAGHWPAVQSQALPQGHADIAVEDVGAGTVVRMGTGEPRSAAVATPVAIVTIAALKNSRIVEPPSSLFARV